MKDGLENKHGESRNAPGVAAAVHLQMPHGKGDEEGELNGSLPGPASPAVLMRSIQRSCEACYRRKHVGIIVQ